MANRKFEMYEYRQILVEDAVGGDRPRAVEGRDDGPAHAWRGASIGGAVGLAGCGNAAAARRDADAAATAAGRAPFYRPARGTVRAGHQALVAGRDRGDGDHRGGAAPFPRQLPVRATFRATSGGRTRGRDGEVGVRPRARRPGGFIEPPQTLCRSFF